MKNSLDAWLINEIRNELLSGTHRNAIPSFSVAKAIIERETERADLWRLEKIALIAQREFEKLSRPPSPHQDFLPGMDVADMLPLRNGFIPLGDATWRKLKEGVAAITAAAKERAEQRADRRVSRLKRLIVEMAPYARARHGLTVSAYLELRAAGVEMGAKVRTAGEGWDG